RVAGGGAGGRRAAAGSPLGPNAGGALQKSTRAPSSTYNFCRNCAIAPTTTSACGGARRRTMIAPFRNEAPTDFSQPVARDAFLAALARTEAEFDRDYPLGIRGEGVWSGEGVLPARPRPPHPPTRRVARARRALAERALGGAWAAFPDWAATDPSARARILWRAAALLRQRKHAFSALLVYEVGKTWAEADADTAEAIDFLEYYGREM